MHVATVCSLPATASSCTASRFVAKFSLEVLEVSHTTWFPLESIFCRWTSLSTMIEWLAAATGPTLPKSKVHASMMLSMLSSSYSWSSELEYRDGRRSTRWSPSAVRNCATALTTLRSFIHSWNPVASEPVGHLLSSTAFKHQSSKCQHCSTSNVNSSVRKINSTSSKKTVTWYQFPDFIV